MATFICASKNRLAVELAATEKQSKVIVVSSLFILNPHLLKIYF
jgi:hypothetical protein